MSHAEIMDAVVVACRENQIRNGYIRLVVTRGIGTLGLNPKSCKRPSVIIIADKIQLYPPEFYKRGLDIITVPTVRNLHSALNPAIKSLNYLNNILAKIPRRTTAGCEGGGDVERRRLRGRMQRRQSVHLKNGELSTPPLSAGALFMASRGRR